MPITVEWDNAEQIAIRTTTSGVYTWNEYREVMDEVFAMVEANPQVEAVISVRGDDAQIPAGNPLPHFEATIRRFRLYPDVVIINVNVLSASQLMVNVFGRIYEGFEGRVFAANTLQEARGILNTLRMGKRAQDMHDTSP